MSRRDTIIVAVLVNAGLLIVLFASALKSSAPNGELVLNTPPVVQQAPEPVLKKEVSFAGGDEVDQALNQFSQAQSAAAATPSPVASIEPQAPVASSFADDLRPLAVAEPSAVHSSPNPALQVLTMPIVPQNKPFSEFIEIKVKKGDVLEKIARHHHTTVAEIIKANKLTNTNLRIGQVLKIPNKTIRKAETSTIAYSAQETTVAPVSNEETTKYYTVKKGDSPWTIAVRNHLKVEDLLKLNNMNEEQARRLKPGDKLRIK